MRIDLFLMLPQSSHVFKHSSLRLGLGKIVLTYVHACLCTCHLGSAMPKCPYSGSYIIHLSFDVALASRGTKASQRGVWLILWRLQHRLWESEVRVSLPLWLRRWQQHCSLSTEMMGLEANMPSNNHIWEFGNSIFLMWYSKQRPILAQHVSTMYWSKFGAN